MAEPNVFEFPTLDFGKRKMHAGELEQALVCQLHLYSTYGVTISHPNPQNPRGDAATAYWKHRLAAVAFFARIGIEDSSVFISALNIMDKYTSACIDPGEDPCQLFKTFRNIRVACLSLANKMYDVYLLPTDLVDLNNEKDENEDEENELSTLEGILDMELRIIEKLHGALFPENTENMIGILCKYLILTCTKRRASHSLDRHATMRAAELLTKIALERKLLRFERWKCIAVCCLLGVIEVYPGNPLEGICLEDGLLSLMVKLKPGEFTYEELCDLKGLLTTGCVVCSMPCDSKMRTSLLKVSSKSCADCTKTVWSNDRLLCREELF